jgi:FtsZ-binding cell division protein ZapB
LPMSRCDYVFIGWLVLILFLSTGSVSVAEKVTDKIRKPVEESISIRQKTQKDIEKWSEKKSMLEAEYDALMENNKRLVTEREHLTQTLETMQERIGNLENQIEAMEKISEKLNPFLFGVHKKLVESVNQRLPFLQEERSERLTNLKKTLDDPQIVLGEKFRKVMEVLFIEAEYGNTVEVYQEKIFLSDEDVLVNVLRLGRISLFFETLDQTTTGYFDLEDNQWKILPQSANRDIRIAMEIGSKRRPADIVTLPLGRIGVQ